LTLDRNHSFLGDRTILFTEDGTWSIDSTKVWIWLPQGETLSKNQLWR